ncbi:hypothetical protein ACH0BU_16070 [Sphingomonas olei]
MSSSTLDLGSILATLTAASRRPRYAFLVLGLIAEAARADGRAGPWIRTRTQGPEGEGERVALRDWLARQLAPLAANDRRRATLRAKVAARIATQDAAVIDAAVAEEAMAIGRANVSRAVSDLVRAGLVRRHYAGRITDHVHRGGRRMAVYAVEPPVLNAIRSRPTLV